MKKFYWWWIPLMLLCLAALLVIFITPVEAQPAPHDHGTGTDAECAAYGCLYSHDRCHYTRQGRFCATEYGVAHQRLPDGPDGRSYVGVLWPDRYDPARRGMWDQVAYCESTWRWHFVGRYHGGLQFHPNTWTAYGGGEFAARAYNATPEQQIAVAERVLRFGHGSHGPQGRGAWPSCGRNLR